MTENAATGRRGLNIRGRRSRGAVLPTTEQIRRELGRESFKRNLRKTLRDSLRILIVVAAAAVLIATLVCPVLRIYGTSMTPTIEEGDVVVALKLSKVKRGDVLGVYYGNKLLVKRCIATEGQWVDIDPEGNVYVDDALVDEPYLTEKALGECDISLPYQVPEDSVFVMGDHRQTSLDSRSSNIGSMAEDEIVGRIMFRVWPLNRFGRVK